jgi:sulfoquinovose isomerase
MGCGARGLLLHTELGRQTRPFGHFWWPCCEGVAAASALLQVSDDPHFEMWYRRILSFVDRYLFDRKNGGWFAELDDNLDPVQHVFMGNPDLYHALQASLIPLLPTNGSITKQLLVANGGEVLRGDFPG